MALSINIEPHPTLFIQFPEDVLKGLPSAKSHITGMACRAKVFRRASILGLESQEQIVELRSTLLSTASARYVTTASAYAFAAAPPSLKGTLLTGRPTLCASANTSSRTSPTRSLKVVNAMS